MHRAVYSKHIYVHAFQQRHDRSKYWGRSHAVKPHHTHRISLLLTLILGSALDSCYSKDILLMVGFSLIPTFGLFIVIVVITHECRPRSKVSLAGIFSAY